MAIIRRNPAYLVLALAFAGLVTWGFWQSYFDPLLSGTVDRPWAVHLHAAVFAGWVLLLIAQAGLVASGNVRLHRRSGTAGMTYGVIVFLVGVLVSVYAPALRVRAGEFPAETGGMVALYSLFDLLLFGIFLALAFAWRSRGDIHKQWVIAATAALGGAAVGRVLATDSIAYLLVWLSPVLALVAINLARYRRISFVPLISGGLIVVAFFKVPLLASPLWQDIGRVLVEAFVPGDPAENPITGTNWEGVGVIPDIDAQPGGAEAVRRMSDELARGEPDYELLTPQMAEVARNQLATCNSSFPRSATSHQSPLSKSRRTSPTSMSSATPMVRCAG
jgi:hypothetical protein